MIGPRLAQVADQCDRPPGQAGEGLDVGDEANQIPPGTPFRLLPDTWNCPNCSTEKHKFMVIGSAAPSDTDAVQRLANAYRRAALKVRGLPIYNPTLAVEAVGFREHEGRRKLPRQVDSR